MLENEPPSPIITARCLYYQPSGFITSPMFLVSWSAGQLMRAQCFATAAHSDDCPAEDCGCGFYGLFKITKAFESVVGFLPHFQTPSVVHVLPFIVLAEHYGKIQIHENGLRSEFVRVISAVSFREDLVTFDKYRELAKRAADLLRVPQFGHKTSQEFIDNSLAVNGI